MRLECFRQAETGFTLLELLVALTILGLGLVFVLPGLTAWFDSMRLASDQRKFEDAMGVLGSEARRAGRAILLRSSPTGLQKPSGSVPLDLPSGWMLQVDPPIAFRYNGLCIGGTVRLVSPNGEATYHLDGPYCAIQPQ